MNDAIRAAVSVHGTHDLRREPAMIVALFIMASGAAPAPAPPLLSFTA
jgi:hypothetical protein